MRDEMNKSEIMKKAHSIARNLLMVKSVTTYAAAVSEGLRRVWALTKTAAAEAALPVRAIYLNVPYSQKEKAKKAGAKWDAEARSWYVEAAVIPAALQQFRNDMHNARKLSGATWA